MNTDYKSLDGWYENYTSNKWKQRVLDEINRGGQPGQVETLCIHGKIGASPSTRSSKLNVYCDDQECWEGGLSVSEILRVHGIDLGPFPRVGVPTERYD